MTVITLSYLPIIKLPIEGSEEDRARDIWFAGDQLIFSAKEARVGKFSSPSLVSSRRCQLSFELLKTEGSVGLYIFNISQIKQNRQFDKLHMKHFVIWSKML